MGLGSVPQWLREFIESGGIANAMGMEPFTAKMVRLQEMQKPAPGQMPDGPPKPGTPEYDAAVDVASSFDFTGSIGKAGKAAAEALDMAQPARMQRAADLGFDTAEPVYHWSHSDYGDFPAFNVKTAPRQTSFLDGIGVHVGSKDAARDRWKSFHGGKETAQGFTMPMLARKERLLTKKDGSVYSESELRAFLKSKAVKAGLKEPTGREAQVAMRNALWEKYDAVPYRNSKEDRGSVSYILPPENLRSVHAAFDPAKRDSRDLLASMGGIGLGGGLAAMMPWDEDR
jgi:hypothetical protein